MSIEIVVVLVAFVVGCVAVLFAILRLLMAALSWIGRALTGGGAQRTAVDSPPGVCPNHRCGFRDARGAVFCPRCGTRLRRPSAG